MPIFPNYANGSNVMPSGSMGARRPPSGAGRGPVFPQNARATGMPSFDGGGQVGGPPTGGNPLQSALAYGRRKAGLPADFDRGPAAEPSFDDGGMVPDPSAAPPQQPAPVNPESALKYLSGDGALSPDVVLAMEAMADPDNTMDENARMEAVLGRAPSPDVAFGYLQHKRTKFNGFTAAARVASEKGDYNLAAMYANKAHASVPGSKRRFAPGMGGLKMIDGQPQQPETPAFGQGGTVDSSNPMNTSDEESYEDGGAVEDKRYDDFPDSTNVEDRRNDTVEGWRAKVDGPDPAVFGQASHDRYGEWRAEQDKKTRDMGEGVVRKKKTPFFADGGEVEEEDEVTGAVTEPEEMGAGGGSEDEALTTGATMPPAPAVTAQDMAMDPMSLSPEDFNRMMTVPWDTLVGKSALTDSPLPPHVKAGPVGDWLHSTFKGASDYLGGRSPTTGAPEQPRQPTDPRTRRPPTPWPS